MSAQLERALEAAASARVLLEKELYASACPRAYFAMFNAARALLFKAEGVELEAIKTHKTVLRLFSMHFVREGRFDSEIVRHFRRADEIRAVADYDDEPIDTGEAVEIVKTMEAFPTSTQALLAEPRP